MWRRGSLKTITGSYAVEIVMNEDLAIECWGEKRHFFINAMKEFEEMFDEIMNSKMMLTLLHV